MTSRGLSCLLYCVLRVCLASRDSRKYSFIPLKHPLPLGRFSPAQWSHAEKEMLFCFGSFEARGLRGIEIQRAMSLVGAKPYNLPTCDEYVCSAR